MPASQLVSVGEYTYAWYSYGCIEVYSGHTLLKVFEQKVRLLNGEAGVYIGHHTCDPKNSETGENILSVSDGQPLLAQNVPYRLYKVGEEIIGYRDFESKTSRLNSGEKRFGPSTYPCVIVVAMTPTTLTTLKRCWV